MDRHRDRASRRNANKVRKDRKNRRKSCTIWPCVPLDLDNPARTALVYWRGKGEPLLYRLDHLDSHELKRFWKMDPIEKAEYLRTKFNRHHRRPGCQKGKTTRDNLSHVDICSHVCYNGLISVVACWSGVPIEKVFTQDTENFLRRVYPHLRNLMSRNDNQRLKGLEVVTNQKNLSDVSRTLIVNVAKWAKVKPKAVHVMDVCRFLERIYGPIKRLALDHDSRKLKTLTELFRTLNEIWLPVDEQIELGKQ